MKFPLSTMKILLLYIEQKENFVKKYTRDRWNIETGRSPEDYVLILKRRACVEFAGVNKTTVEFYSDEFVRWAKRYHGKTIETVD